MAPSVTEPAAAVPAVTKEVTVPVQKKKQTVKEGVTSLEALSQGMTLAGIPSFTDIEKKRHWMLEHMAGAFRVFARRGYTEGLAGHISLRDPENPDTFWTNPFGRHFGLLTVSDMILVNERGEAIGGNTSRPSNAAGFLIHHAVHHARPDVNAACHMHSVYGKAWSAFGRGLDMINQDVCVFYGNALGVYNDFGGVVLSEDEGKNLASALGKEGKGLILRNHGLLTVGGTVDEAAYLFTLLERSCEVQLLCESARLPKIIIGDDEANYTFKMTSVPETIYCEFQPDYEMELELTGGAFLK